MTLGWEALAALAVGVFLLVLVLQPLMPGSGASVPVVVDEYEGMEADETPSGLAVAALREIEFDRATGKLSDADYEMLKTSYTRRALAALRDDSGAPATDVESLIASRVAMLDAEQAMPAVFDSATGEAVGTGHCRVCSAAHVPTAYYCEECGVLLAGR